ncbi:hypothetical protein BDZ45DRAFT_596539, partial [Acephala macrosclerotiorum]
SDVWEQAVQAHLASLTPSQQATFKPPANAEDCLDILTKSQRRRGYTKVLDAIRPVIQPLKRFENVIDVIIQTNGAMGSPIWGPVKLALMAAYDHLETIEKLAQLLHRIVTSLERYSNYESLFHNHMHVQNAVGLLYSDLLDLCTRVVRFHSPIIFTSFEKDFKLVADNISHHSAQIDWAANAANIAEAKKARQDEENARTAQNRIVIQQWLSPSTVQDDLSRHKADCMHGSCEWAVNTSAARNFLSSQSSSIMRIGGAPGSGKSTLAAFIIDRLLEVPVNDVLYFFCKGTDETKKHPFQVFRTLASQLLACHDSIYPLFAKLHEQSGQKEAKSLADLKRSICSGISTLSGPIWIVVDALDECDDAVELMQSLTDLTKLSGIGSVKLVLVCRDEPELLDTLHRSSVIDVDDIVISPNDSRALIWKYVKDRVGRCKNIAGTELGSQVHEEVAAAADGLWLYARLMMDEIQRLPSRASIERQLQNIPRGLSQVYDQIFVNMEKHLNNDTLKIAQQVFLWVDLSTFVNIGAGQLEKTVLDLVVQAANNGEQALNSFELVRELCSPLVTIREDDAGDLSLDFIHHTAAQYIHEASLQGSSAILRPQKLSQFYHGATSVWYFSKSPRSRELLQLIGSEPMHRFAYNSEYFEMAYGLWDAFFVQRLPETLDTRDLDEVTRLCDIMSSFMKSDDCLVWIEMAMLINYRGGYQMLLDNALKAWKHAIQGTKSTFAAFKAYSLLRVQFFWDYSFVLYLTGPRPPGGLDGDLHHVPDGFDNREISSKILALGLKWQHLVPSDRNDSPSPEPESSDPDDYLISDDSDG